MSETPTPTPPHAIEIVFRNPDGVQDNATRYLRKFTGDETAEDIQAAIADITEGVFEAIETIVGRRRGATQIRERVRTALTAYATDMLAAERDDSADGGIRNER